MKLFKLLPLTLFLLISACQLELYSNLSERDANEIISELQDNGVDAEKSLIAVNNYKISVEKADFSRAIQILKGAGLPAQPRANLADLFKPSGLVPTPFEEKVRYAVGLSQEIEKTLSKLEGVIDARIHIVIPTEENYKSNNNQLKIGSASVLINYNSAIDFDKLTNKVRKLVADSIQGVQIENVEVLALPVKVNNSIPAKDYVSMFGARIHAKTLDYYYYQIGFLILIILLLSGILLFITYKTKLKPQKNISNSEKK